MSPACGSGQDGQEWRPQVRCKKCDYRLWNLPARRCPECGTPFRPSEYGFVPNSVRFSCPHCGQAYYGVGPQGHLEPIEYDCLSCGRHIHMDDTILQPTEGVSEEWTGSGYVPWLDRDKRGFSRAWLGTIGMATLCPASLAQALPARSSLGQALRFAMLSQLVFCTFSWPLAYLSLRDPLFSFARSAASTCQMEVLLALLLWPVAAVCVVAVGIGWAFSAHAILRLMGAVFGDWHDMIRVFCYSSAASVFFVIPCAGIYVGLLWWAVSAILMIEVTHRVSVRRALAAIMIPPVMVILSAFVTLQVSWLWDLHIGI